jgi:hypothetical protein
METQHLIIMQRTNTALATSLEIARPSDVNDSFDWQGACYRGGVSGYYRMHVNEAKNGIIYRLLRDLR